MRQLSIARADIFTFLSHRFPEAAAISFLPEEGHSQLLLRHVEARDRRHLDLLTVAFLLGSGRL